MAYNPWCTFLWNETSKLFKLWLLNLETQAIGFRPLQNCSKKVIKLNTKKIRAPGACCYWSVYQLFTMTVGAEC